MSGAPTTVADAVHTGASAESSLRVLHVLDHSLPLHSGYTFRTLSILDQQRALGWETFQLTSTKQGPAAALEEKVANWTFFRTPSVWGPTGRLPIVKYGAMMRALRLRLANAVNRVQPDILHVHSPVLNAYPAFAVGRRTGIPVVYEVRAFWEDAAVDLGTAREWGPRYRLTRGLETRALRRADAVTTICEGLKRDMLERGIDGTRITVIPNAVDAARFKFAGRPDTQLVQRFGLTPGRTLGFAGSFYAYEGLDLTLRALPALLAAMPEVRLLLVGGGPRDAALRQLAKELGITHAVHFTGRVPHADVARYYSVMDIMVYPRTRRRLTELVTPLKPLEAMAMGKLVVASDVGGHRELIRDGDNGHLFTAGSSAALGQCLHALLCNRASWQQVIDRGRGYVERERTWQASVARYREVYVSALQRAGKMVREGILHAR